MESNKILGLVGCKSVNVTNKHILVFRYDFQMNIKSFNPESPETFLK